MTPPMFMEYECRLDTKDPDLWLECTNPMIFSNLASGVHTLEVRAESGGSELVDPTPARFSWTVAQGTNCDTANITLTATADGWVNEVVPWENYLFETELSVASDATGDPDAVPPVPTIGQNARSLFRFDLPTDAANCTLESATLRLFNDGPEGGDEGRTILATPLAGPFKESTLTWMSQPGTWPNQPDTSSDDPVAVVPPQTDGYMEWNVLSHVEEMLAAGVSYGWQIRDSHESDLENGAEQSFTSRETFQEPPPEPGTLPELVLRYADDDTTVPPPPADPTGPPVEAQCGQVITESTLLADDVTGCIGEGLIIGAPNIVLDLGGHTVSSNAVFIAGQENGLISGIRNSGHSERRHPQRHRQELRLRRHAHRRHDLQRRPRPEARGPHPRRHRAERRRRRAERQHDPQQRLHEQRRGGALAHQRHRGHAGQGQRVLLERRRRLPADRGQPQPLRGQRDARRVLQPQHRQ